MVKFDQVADKEKVIYGGPWLIFDHEFASPNAKIERTVEDDAR